MHGWSFDGRGTIFLTDDDLLCCFWTLPDWNKCSWPKLCFSVSSWWHIWIWDLELNAQFICHFLAGSIALINQNQDIFQVIIITIVDRWHDHAFPDIQFTNRTCRIDLSCPLWIHISMCLFALLQFTNDDRTINDNNN